jgi:hypothetical protein
MPPSLAAAAFLRFDERTAKPPPQFSALASAIRWHRVSRASIRIVASLIT